MSVVSYLEFRSRMDRWLVWVLLGCCFILVAACILTLVGDSEGTFSKVFVVLISVSSLVFILWILFGTRYRLTQSHLLVRSGPFRHKILLDTITSIEPTNSLLSSPALSRDRFLIRYHRYDTVMISPEDRGRFLKEVAERAPHLIWEGEKLVEVSG